MENLARLAQVQKRIKDWGRLIVAEAPNDHVRAAGSALISRLQVVITRIWEQKTATATDSNELNDLERQLEVLHEEVRLALKPAGHYTAHHG